MNRILSLLLLTVSFSLFTAKAQDMHKIDSLNNELRKFELKKKEMGSKAPAMYDTTKANILYAISREYTISKFDTAILLTNQVLALSEKMGYKKGIGNYYQGMGNINKIKNNLDLALEYYQKALKIREEIGDKKAEISTANTIAGLNFNPFDYPRAIKYYEKALKLNEEIHDSIGITDSYNSIGAAYANQANYPEALKYFLKRLKVNQEIGIISKIADSYNDVGFIYDQAGNNPDAIKNYQLSLNISEELKDSSGIGVTVSNMGVSYFKLGNDSAALKNQLRSLDIGERIGETELVEFSYVSIGDIYQKEKNYAEAIKNYKSALNLYKGDDEKKIRADTYIHIGIAYEKQNNLNEALKYSSMALKRSIQSGNKDWIKQSYEELAIINARLNNYKAAYENEVLFKQYNDTVFNKDNEKKLTGIQMQFEFDKIQDSTKAEQGKKDLIATNEIKRQKNVRNYTLLGLCIVLLFSIVVFRQRNNIRKGKKRSDELLLNILPEEVAEELKEKGSAEAKMFDDVTVMFTDFKGFTTIAEKLSAKDLVGEINFCFSAFDNIIHKYGIEKIKTIGDSYMAVGGLPVANKTHAKDVVNAAIEINKFMEAHKQQRIKDGKEIFEIRIGIHTGPVVAGIVGIKKFAYDIWGDTVNLASRMESSGEAGKVNISGSTYELIKNDFTCTYRGKIQAKNKGEVDMYFVNEL